MKVQLHDNKILTVVNLLIGVLLFSYFGFLDSHYCLSADDFAGIDYSSRGIPGFSFAWHFYWAWEGPFLSHFVHGLLMWSVWAGTPPVFILGLSKLAVFGSSAALVSAISFRFELNRSRSEVMFMALVFTLVLYLISPQPTQIWHWLTGMLYLYPLIFLMLGLAALVRGKVLLAILPLAVVMQSRATYAVPIFGFLFLVLLINWFSKEKTRTKWLILTAFSLVFLIIYLIAPGNYVRMTAHGNSNMFMISQAQVGLHNLFISFNLAKMDRVVLGLMAVLPVLGASIMVPRPRQKWKLAIPALLYLCFAVFHEALFVYITGYHEWERVLSLHSLLFLMTVSIYGFWCFDMIDQKWHVKLWPLSLVGILGLCFHLFYGYGNELNLAHVLKTDHSLRMERILSHDQVDDTLYVNPIHYTGILYFEDFSEDPGHWINKDFTKAYHLNHKIAVTPTQHED